MFNLANAQWTRLSDATVSQLGEISNDGRTIIRHVMDMGYSIWQLTLATYKGKWYLRAPGCADKSCLLQDVANYNTLTEHVKGLVDVIDSDLIIPAIPLSEPDAQAIDIEALTRYLPGPAELVTDYAELDRLTDEHLYEEWRDWLRDEALRDINLEDYTEDQLDELEDYVYRCLHAKWDSGELWQECDGVLDGDWQSLSSDAREYADTMPRLMAPKLNAMLNDYLFSFPRRRDGDGHIIQGEPEEWNPWSDIIWPSGLVDAEATQAVDPSGACDVIICRDGSQLEWTYEGTSWPGGHWVTHS